MVETTKLAWTVVRAGKLRKLEVRFYSRDLKTGGSLADGAGYLRNVLIACRAALEMCRRNFAPRVLEADPASPLDESGSNLDSDRIWATRRATAAGSRATFRVSNKRYFWTLVSNRDNVKKS
jgi:hypothetical protein